MPKEGFPFARQSLGSTARWAQWVGVAAVGSALGTGVAWLVDWLVGVPLSRLSQQGGYLANAPPSWAPPWVNLGVGGAIAFGIVLGTSQSLLLRKLMGRDQSWRWIVATTVGWALGLPWGEGLRGMAGLSVGVAQWLVMRGFAPKPGWWILGNVAAGFVLRVDLLDIAGGALDGSFISPLGAMGLGAMLGAAYGAITGVVLVRLFAHTEWIAPGRTNATGNARPSV